MSWSFSVSGNVSDIRDVVAPDLDPYMKDQYYAALDAALELINRNVLGDQGKTFRVGLNGHGNPGHAPAAGWTNDSITITVSQL